MNRQILRERVLRRHRAAPEEKPSIPPPPLALAATVGDFMEFLVEIAAVPTLPSSLSSGQPVVVADDGVVVPASLCIMAVCGMTLGVMFFVRRGGNGGDPFFT